MTTMEDSELNRLRDEISGMEKKVSQLEREIEELGRHIQRKRRALLVVSDEWVEARSKYIKRLREIGR